MPRALTGRADLFRVLVHGDKPLQDAAAELLGLEATPVLPWRAKSKERKPTSARTSPGLQIESGASTSSEQPRTTFRPAATPFWRAESLEILQPPEQGPDPPPTPPGTSELRELNRNPRSRVNFTPIARLNQLVAWLHRELAESHEGRQLDLRKTVDEIGRARWLDRLPRLQRRSWGRDLFLVRDFSTRLMPFDRDFETVIPILRKVFPRESVLEASLWEEVDNPVIADPIQRMRAMSLPPPGTTVLALTDLGLLGDADGYGTTDSGIEFWSHWGSELRKRGHRTIAFSPIPIEAPTTELVSSWQVVPWASGRTIQSAGDRPTLTTTREAADRVLRLLSMAIRIEPGLLRAVRLLVPSARANPAVESLVWNDPRITDRHPIAATMEPSVADALLEELFAEEEETIIREAFALILAWHATLPEEIRFEEVLRLGKSRRSALFDPELLSHAEAWFRRLTYEAVTEWSVESGNRGDFDWSLRFATRFPGAEWERSSIAEDLGRLTKLAAQNSDVAELPGSVSLVEASDLTKPIKTCRMTLAGTSVCATLAFNEREALAPQGSPIAEVRFRQRLGLRPEFSFQIDRDFWADGVAPGWASDWGFDEFGLWAELSVSGRFGDLQTRYRAAHPYLKSWMEGNEFTHKKVADAAGVGRATVGRFLNRLSDGMQLSDGEASVRLLKWVELHPEIAIPPRRVGQRLRWIAPEKF